ncbi:hypothetical protein [Comamonas sp.]|uniref:hypothetical protein n=1 Tax=Comamonas sp. TaxID=34028 RepID=UPI00289DBE7F|nr:hypothetical protein [Comamonas sp.]
MDAVSIGCGVCAKPVIDASLLGNNAPLVRGLMQVNKRVLSGGAVGKGFVATCKQLKRRKDHALGVVLAVVGLPQNGGALDIYQELFLISVCPEKSRI